PAQLISPQSSAATGATTPPSKTASTDATTAAHHLIPRKDSSRPRRPARDPHSVNLASPIRYTNRKNRPRKTDRPPEPPRENDNSPTHRLPSPLSSPPAQKASGPPAAPAPQKHTAPSPALPAPPAPPAKPRPARTYPDSQTETAPHSKSCSQTTVPPATGRQTTQCPSPARPLTPGKIASHPCRTDHSGPRDPARCPWIWTSSPRSPYAPANADTPREREPAR